MVKNMEDIIDNILELPANSRACLAELLLENLDFEEDFPINEEWMKEIKKRCQELDEGKFELIPGNEGLAQLRKKYS